MFDPELELEAELESLMAHLAGSDLRAEAEVFGNLGSNLRGQARDAYDQARVPALVAKGMTDENKLSDAIFYDRHPDWKGKSLKYASAVLRSEWMHIRDDIARPGLRRPAAAAPTPSPQPAPAATPAAKQPLGQNTFQNIARYQGWNFMNALGAQGQFLKVSWFLPYYTKLNTAARGVRISEGEHGIGELSISIDRTSLLDLVEDPALRNKAFEIMSAALTSELVFSDDVIGLLGLGMTMFDIAQGLKNEKMLNAADPGHDKWLLQHQLQVVFGLMAEDLVRRGDTGHFVSRSAPDLKQELQYLYYQFQPVWSEYGKYVDLDKRLGLYQGNIPDVPAPPQIYAR